MSTAPALAAVRHDDPASVPVELLDQLPLLASSEGGSAAFQLMPGDYFVNCAFGRAGVTKKLNVPTDGDVSKQTLVLDAGLLTR